jgi:hypothetical protein
MNGVLLGFQIAAGIALFLLVFFVIIPRLSLHLRVWWYQTIVKDKTPPPEIRKYLVKSGMRTLKKVKNLPPEVQQRVALQVLTAALDDKDGTFDGIHSEMIADAMQFLGAIPLEHCATCKRPVFTHEATKTGDQYFCASCGQTRKATQMAP